MADRRCEEGRGGGAIHRMAGSVIGLVDQGSASGSASARVRVGIGLATPCTRVGWCVEKTAVLILESFEKRDEMTRNARAAIV